MDALDGDRRRRHGLRLDRGCRAGARRRRTGAAPLGAIGELGALSFHETKNVTCGEGGALLINDPALVERAEILRRRAPTARGFFRGEVDKYTWVDVGSSFLLSEINAAFLLGAARVRRRDHARARSRSGSAYHDGVRPARGRPGSLRRPVVPGHCTHNAHLYYLLAPDEAAATR